MTTTDCDAVDVLEIAAAVVLVLVILPVWIGLVELGKRLPAGRVRDLVRTLAKV